MDELTDATHAAHSTSMVTGLFPDRDSAEMAFRSLADCGYDENDMNLMMSIETRQRCFAVAPRPQPDADEAEVRFAETVGAIDGAIAASGNSVLVPGLDVVVAGPLAASMAGAGIGGITGGLAGALVGWGIPEDHVKEYEAGIKHGGILMAVKPHNEQDALHLEQNWKNNRGEHVYH